jgi:hypothetical protein
MHLPTFGGTCYLHLDRLEPRCVSYGGPLTEAFHSTRDRKKWSQWQQNVLKMALYVMAFPYKKKLFIYYTKQRLL